MEVFRTEDFYIFVNGEYSLWWDRSTGAFIPKAGWELTAAEDPICLGICQGIVGKVYHPVLFESRLLLIRESTLIGKLHGDNKVHKIKSVIFINLGSENVDLGLQPCHKHKSAIIAKGATGMSIFDVQKGGGGALSKTWGTLKSAGSTIKSTTQQAAAAAIATATPKKKDGKEREKFEKQIVEEFYKIFNDTDSFYFCETSDLTNSLQMLCGLEKENKIQMDALWKTVDDRFFWNRHMLKELIESNNPLFNPWILPIIQGFIQIEECKVELSNDYRGVETSPKIEIFKLTIISRRSRFRAGTRYKRRGVDENGECANYVETEQIVSYQHHEVSFVQSRGSVPVFWSQPGFKYRPPPRIDKGKVENHAAFVKHFTKELARYGPICIINLVEQQGKEKIIWDAYSDHVFQYNNPQITYCTFDFHEYCKGMHFENVSILVTSIADIIRDMNYCWRDKQGHICSQKGVFRVNCIDCLDRTNVVQTALGKAVMEIQFTKLGLISPEGSMPTTIKKTFQLLWANNGDTISKQYAGTNALKGDYTRTGERKFTGIMKDGMNSANRYYRHHFKDNLRQCCLDIMLDHESVTTDARDSYLAILSGIANEFVPSVEPIYIPHIALSQEYELSSALYYLTRYYLSRFKDSTRQGTIDLMLGNCVSDDIFSENRAHHDDEDGAATAEHVKLLIEDCKKMLLNTPEASVGSWGLINADPNTGDPSETEMDAILILTRDSYFVADYDDQVDRITKYQRVLLQDLVLLECGTSESSSLFRTIKPHYCIRLNYKVNGAEGYYHMFRSTNLSFFNNLTVQIKNEDEEIESLKAICEAFQVSIDIAGLAPIPFRQGQKLDRRKSKVVLSGSTTSSSIYLDVMGLPNLTRNVSESQLLAIKSAGSKALSNVTHQFSKLNKLGSPFITAQKRGKKAFTVGKEENNSSSSDSEEYENSIFQPASPTAIGTEKNDSIEQGVELTGGINFFETEIKVDDTYLPGVGIVMGNPNETTNESYIGAKPNLGNDNLNVDNERLLSVMQTAGLGPPPLIQINETGQKLMKKLSHSSGEVEKQTAEGAAKNDNPNAIFIANENRSSSSQDFTLNISQSQSESALKSKLTTLTSPVTNVTKGIMLSSPLTKFAKGVQNLGSNLDPRKLSAGVVKQVSEKEMEEHRKIQEKWRHCNTRLIAL